MSRTAAVLISSTRAATGVYADTTGPVIRDWLSERGFTVGDPILAVDGDPFAAALTAELTLRPDLIITSGGTGISPTDRTATITAAALDYEIPGIAEEIRRQGVAKVPTAILSRGVAGVVRPDAGRQPARVEGRGEGRAGGAGRHRRPRAGPAGRRRPPAVAATAS